MVMKMRAMYQKQVDKVYQNPSRESEAYEDKHAAGLVHWGL